MFKKEAHNTEYSTEMKNRDTYKNDNLSMLSSANILWRIDPLLSNDHKNSGRYYVTNATMELLLETRYFLYGLLRVHFWTTAR
jgi:hypothetical protein